jgi:hypothetical protein
MGAGGASTGGSDTADEKKQDSYAKQFKKNYKVNKYGKVEEKNFVEKYIDNSPILNNPITRKTEQVNRDFFENKVKRNTNKFSNYEDYIRARGRGEVDAMGREITQRDGGNNQPAQETIIKKNIGGSEVQTTQAKIDEQRAKDDEYDIRKVKKEGRKRYTLTSSKGVTQVSDDYSLGKKSLLGSV